MFMIWSLQLVSVFTLNCDSQWIAFSDDADTHLNFTFIFEGVEFSQIEILCNNFETPSKKFSIKCNFLCCFVAVEYLEDGKLGTKHVKIST